MFTSINNDLGDPRNFILFYLLWSFLGYFKRLQVVKYMPSWFGFNHKHYYTVSGTHNIHTIHIPSGLPSLCTVLVRQNCEVIKLHTSAFLFLNNNVQLDMPFTSLIKFAVQFLCKSINDLRDYTF